MPKIWRLILGGFAIGVIGSIVLVTALMRHILAPKLVGLLVVALWLIGYVVIRRLMPNWRDAQKSPTAFTTRFTRWARVLGTLCVTSGVAAICFAVLMAKKPLWVLPGVAALCFGALFLLMAMKAGANDSKPC